MAGDGLEVEGQPSISALVGKPLDGTSMTPFTVSRESADQDVLRARSGGDASEAGRPGFLAFADLFSPIPVALAALDAAHPASVVAGGLSCPVSQSSRRCGRRCRARAGAPAAGIARRRRAAR